MASPTLTQPKTETAPTVSPIERFAGSIAKEFGVRVDEVAILRLKSGILSFIHPLEMAGLVSIPVTCNRSVASRTALTGQSEMHNNFVKVPHSEIFETLRPAGIPANQSLIIQKLMSVALTHIKERVGVLQVCRKADTIFSAGPDFQSRDLYRLEALSRDLAPMLK